MSAIRVGVVGAGAIAQLAHLPVLSKMRGAQLVALGVRRLVIAGGETAGAVVQALGVEALAIGPPIDPGVPWTMSLGEPRIALALKSGNFGGDDFFDRALALMP